MIQITKIWNERENINTDFTDIKIIIRDYYEELHANKFDNLQEKHKFLDACNLLSLNHQELENLNRSIRNMEILLVIKKKKPYNNKNSSGSDDFISEFYQTFKTTESQILPKS